jgi:hypothetical protein
MAETEPLTRRKDIVSSAFFFVISTTGKWKRKRQTEDKGGPVNDAAMLYATTIQPLMVGTSAGQHYVGQQNALHHRLATTVLKISTFHSVFLNH